MYLEGLKQEARTIAFRDLPEIIHPKLGILASGARNEFGVNRFNNLFWRDAFISVLAAYSDCRNWNLNSRLLLFPGIRTLLLAALNQSQFSLIVDENGSYVQMVGDKPFELHNKYTPQARIDELVADGHKLEFDSDGTKKLLIREADDINALFVLAASTVLDVVDYKYGSKEGDFFLDVFYPHIESSLLNDAIYYDLEGEGIIKSYYNPRKRYANRTWRDSCDAFIAERHIPTGNLAFLANNSWSAESFRKGACLSYRKGNFGLAKYFFKRHLKAKGAIQDRFWLRDLHCFSPVLEDGQPVKIVTNESYIPLFVEVADSKQAEEIAERMEDKDMRNRWGTYTRSTRDPEFRTNGAEAYHRGPVWGFLDDLGAQGARKYNMVEFAEDLTERSCNNVIDENGNPELNPVTPDGDKQIYKEGGEVRVCKPQAWKVNSTLAITAGLLNIGEEAAVCTITGNGKISLSSEVDEIRMLLQPLCLGSLQKDQQLMPKVRQD